MIAPCPNPNTKIHQWQSYTHLASFLRDGKTRSQQVKMWSKVGEIMLSTLETNSHNHDRNRLLWLSTSGLGVSWLHIRIDYVPKYYNHLEYTKTSPKGSPSGKTESNKSSS
jgi:hypothetical protein